MAAGHRRSAARSAVARAWMAVIALTTRGGRWGSARGDRASGCLLVLGPVLGDAWQRASNENMAGLLRDSISQGSDLIAFTATALDQVAGQAGQPATPAGPAGSTRPAGRAPPTARDWDHHHAHHRTRSRPRRGSACPSRTFGRIQHDMIANRRASRLRDDLNVCLAFVVAQATLPGPRRRWCCRPAEGARRTVRRRGRRRRPERSQVERSRGRLSDQQV